MSAPIPQLGDVETATYTTGSTLVVAKPAGTADGDRLVMVFYARNSSGTITPPSGWTAAQSENTSGTMAIYTKPIPVAASEAATSYSWTVTGGSGRGIGILFRVSDVHRTGPVDAVGTAVTSGTASVTNPAVAAGVADTLLVSVWSCSRGDATQPVITPPGTMTAVAGVAVSTGAATSYLQVAVQTLSAAGSTGTKTATVSPAATAAAGFMVTLAPIVTASVTMTAGDDLAAAAQQVYNATVALAAGDALDAGAGSQSYQGSADLTQPAVLAATAAYNERTCLTSGGLWQPATQYQLVSGAWVQT